MTYSKDDVTALENQIKDIKNLSNEIDKLAKIKLEFWDSCTCKGPEINNLEVASHVGISLYELTMSERAELCSLLGYHTGRFVQELIKAKQEELDHRINELQGNR